MQRGRHRDMPAQWILGVTFSIATTLPICLSSPALPTTVFPLSAPAQTSDRRCPRRRGGQDAGLCGIHCGVLSLVWVGGPAQARRPQWWRAERRVCREGCHRGVGGGRGRVRGIVMLKSGMRVCAGECGRSAVVRRVTAVKSRCKFRTANCAEVRASSRLVQTISATVQRGCEWTMADFAACSGC